MLKRQTSQARRKCGQIWRGMKEWMLGRGKKDKQKTVVVARRRLRSLTERVWTDRLETLISCLCIFPFPIFPPPSHSPTVEDILRILLSYWKCCVFPLCLLIHFLATSIITEGMLSLPLTSHYWETAMKAIMYSRRMKGRGARCLQSCVLEF